MADILTTEGVPYEGCPRSLLRRMTGELAALGFEMKIGFETEFVIANKDNTFPDTGTYQNAKSFEKFADLLEEIYESLEALGVRVLTSTRRPSPLSSRSSLTTESQSKSVTSCCSHTRPYLPSSREEDTSSTFYQAMATAPTCTPASGKTERTSPATSVLNTAFRRLPRVSSALSSNHCLPL